MKSFFSKKIVVGALVAANCMRIGYNGCKSTGICCAGRYCQFLCLAGNVPGWRCGFSTHAGVWVR